MGSASRRGFLAAGLGAPVAAAAAAAAGQFRYKVLGRTGLKVSTVGFGTMITSDASVIERGADLGVTYFDTARGYQSGNCERMVGAALKSRRKDLVLSTKSKEETKEGALADLELSLKELGTDYIDIWYLHAKSRADQITEGRLEAQEIAKKKGMVRFTGVSTHAGFADIIPAVVRSGKFDVILTAYNFTMGETIDPLIKQAKDAGLGVVAMKVMAGGFRRAKPGDKLYQTLKKEGAMVAALKWTLRNPSVDTTIPSITDMDQLEENLRAMAEPFSPGDAQILARQEEFIRPLYCRACGRCEGQCPKGVPVADVVRCAMYADGYGQFALGRENFLELAREVRDVRCRDCSTCAVRCPNGVAVAQRVARAQELFA